MIDNFIIQAMILNLQSRIKELEDLKEYALKTTGLPGDLRAHIDATLRDYKGAIKIYED